MAEIKTPYGTVVGLILDPVPQEQVKEEQTESADKSKRTREPKDEK